MFLVSILICLGSIGPIATTEGAAIEPEGEGEVIRASYLVDTIGQGCLIFALPPGHRTIRAFIWEPDAEAVGDWRSARLRLVWDGDDPKAAAVDIPLGRFVRPDESAASSRSSLFINRRPMPYRRSGRLHVDFEGPIQGTFRLIVGPGGSDLDTIGYLHAEVLGSRDPGEKATPPSNLDRTNPDETGGSGPSVRFWYDDRPGPIPKSKPESALESSPSPPERQGASAP